MRSIFDTVNEDMLKITEYKLLGKLPDPFLKDNGERISSPEEWEERRKEIYKTAVELQYGSLRSLNFSMWNCFITA